MVEINAFVLLIYPGLVAAELPLGLEAVHQRREPVVVRGNRPQHLLKL